jgi:hypothetical protein
LLQGEGCGMIYLFYSFLSLLCSSLIFIVGNLEKFENNLNLNHDSFLDIVTELNKNSVLDTFKKMKFLTNTTVPKTPKDTVVFAFIEYGTPLIYTLHVEVDEEYVFSRFKDTSMLSEFTNFILEFMHKKCEFTQHRSASLRLHFFILP